ncbi:MAG: SPFH/Band 7/PHB domain protein [Clostridia bacterium]|nr:SPFH/Band 7/PHB domain protein [Clostridia bacterium]
MGWFFIIVIVFFAIIAFSSIKVVEQSTVFVVERLGRFSGVLNAGVHILIPFFDKVRARVSLKENTMDVPPQGVITKDNVNITIDTVVFYQITDAQKAVYEIEDLRAGVRYLATTTLRDIVGKMDLDSTFSSREEINLKLRQTLDEATDKWGCKVNRVEIKDINPPKDIRDAMEKQMNAERTKRSSILLAEGEKESAIRIAEGQKEARILEAEADRETNIKRAEGIRQAKILEATGEAEAIERIAEAKSREIEVVYGAIKNAQPDDKLVALKSLEALEKVANGSANKVFIPFDTTKALGALGTMKEITKD